METLLESIRAAVSPDANDASRTVGAAACRTILAALEARAGEPMAAPIAMPSSPIEAAVSMLASVSPDQLLDLAIAKLRAALPADKPVAPATPMKLQILKLPHGLGNRNRP